MKKLFLDDTRKPPDSSWDIVRSYDAFVAYIKEHGVPDIISFDHDLAFEHYPFNNSSFGYSEPPKEIPYHRYKEKTGYDCAKWLCENGLKPKQWQVHSMNTVGKANIISLLSNPRNFNDRKICKGCMARAFNDGELPENELAPHDENCTLNDDTTNKE